MWTGKSATPPDALKVCHAGRLVWKQPLKLWQRTRKWQLTSQKYIDSHDRLALVQTLNILQIDVVCDNRISTGWPFVVLRADLRLFVMMARPNSVAIFRSAWP